MIILLSLLNSAWLMLYRYVVITLSAQASGA